MREARVWVLGRNFKHWVHVTERGSENQVVTLGCKLVERCCGFCTFWNVFQAGNSDAELCFERCNTLVVLIGVTSISRNADVDNGNFQVAVIATSCCCGV